MKWNFLIPLALAASSALTMSAQTSGGSLTLTSSTDSLNNKSVTIEVRNIEVNGQWVQDTVSITSYSNLDETETLGERTDSLTTRYHVPHNKEDYEWGHSWRSIYNMLVVFPLVFIALVLLVLGLVLYFRYKNRQSRYRLIAKALESGQPLPKELQDEAKKAFRQGNPHDESLRQLRTKGISNMATGLGLFILLWALTDSFALGCIGLLVLCIGLGKLVNYHLLMKDAQSLRSKSIEKPSPKSEETKAEEVKE